MAVTVRVPCVIAFLASILMVAVMAIGIALPWYETTVTTLNVVIDYNITGVRTTSTPLPGVTLSSGLRWLSTQDTGNTPNLRNVFLTMGFFSLVALLMFLFILIVFVISVIPGIRNLVRGQRGRVGVIAMGVLGGVCVAIACLVLLRFPTANAADFNAQTGLTCQTGECMSLTGTETNIIVGTHTWGPSGGWIAMWIAEGLNLLVLLLTIATPHIFGY